jgi:hypothetical protein
MSFRYNLSVLALAFCFTAALAGAQTPSGYQGVKNRVLQEEHYHWWMDFGLKFDF